MALSFEFQIGSQSTQYERSRRSGESSVRERIRRGRAVIAAAFQFDASIGYEEAPLEVGVEFAELQAITGQENVSARWAHGLDALPSDRTNSSGGEYFYYATHEKLVVQSFVGDSGDVINTETPQPLEAELSPLPLGLYSTQPYGTIDMSEDEPAYAAGGRRADRVSEPELKVGRHRRNEEAERSLGEIAAVAHLLDT